MFGGSTRLVKSLLVGSIYKVYENNQTTSTKRSQNVHLYETFIFAILTTYMRGDGKTCQQQKERV